MVPVARNKAFGLYFHFIDQHGKHFKRHFRIVQQTHWLSFFTFIQTGLQLFNKLITDVFINVQLGIPCQLYRKSFQRIVIENIKNIIQAVFDDVFSQDNKL
ncbi:hypothetical protein D3C87_1813980 [compost metagenome]